VNENDRYGDATHPRVTAAQVDEYLKHPYTPIGTRVAVIGAVVGEFVGAVGGTQQAAAVHEHAHGRQDGEPDGDPARAGEASVPADRAKAPPQCATQSFHQVPPTVHARRTGQEWRRRSR
jgi:hypothetical protein